MFVYIYVCLFIHKRRRTSLFAVFLPATYWLRYVYICTVSPSAVRPIPRAAYCPVSSLLCRCYYVREQSIVSIRQHTVS